MTVRVKEFASAASTPFNLWSDNFAETSAQAMANYAHYTHSTPANINTNTWSLGGVHGGLVFAGAGSANVVFSHWTPNQLPGALSRSQFAEANIWIVTNTTRGGLGVMVSGDHQNGNFNSAYLLLSTLDTASFAIQKNVNNVVTNIATGLTAPADGDKVAFSAEIQSTQVVLKYYINGVLISTQTDNTGTRITTGLPSMYQRNTAVGTSIEFGNLRMGILSRLGY